MCLTKAKRIYPSEDTVVYKALYSNGVLDGETHSPYLYSPYQNMFWVLGKMRSVLTDSELHNFETAEVYFNGYYNDDKNKTRSLVDVYGNAYHTFENLEDAIHEATLLSAYRNRPFLVYKCTIPKNSVYVYHGTYDRKPAYASEKLVIDELVETVLPDELYE